MEHGIREAQQEAGRPGNPPLHLRPRAFPGARFSPRFLFTEDAVDGVHVPSWHGAVHVLLLIPLFLPLNDWSRAGRPV